jgi:3-phenylpropionate/trans-cinnamate dioxygenase ferredoxin reductase subunit
MTDELALLVLGGGPAGFAAARGFRAEGGEGPVAIITDEQRMPYERPPLTKELLRGESEESDLPLEDETWLEHEHVELVSGRAVTLDIHDRKVGLAGGRELSYKACVLAMGAEPLRLPVPGADHPAVRVLRSLDDLRELQHRLIDGTRVVVIGSGFIGCEIAASLKTRGHSVALITEEPVPNAARLGEEAGAVISGWLADDGVELHLGQPVKSIEHRGGQLIVCAENARVQGTVVVMAAGVRPRSELAALAGLECLDGAIPVDAGMRTHVTSLFAAGDVCFAENAAAARRLRVEHWDDALRHGEIAGRNAAGAGERWDEVPGFWSQIGDHMLQYAAWGDGFDSSDFEERGDHGFAVRYRRAGKLVGVLTHEADEDFDEAKQAISVHKYV